jgi:hypothetical protein
MVQTSKNGQLHSPAAASLGQDVQCPLNRTKGGLQGRTGRCSAHKKSLLLVVIEPGFISRSVRCQAVTGCYWLSCRSSAMGVRKCKSRVYVCSLNCVSRHSAANTGQCSSDIGTDFFPVIPPLLHSHSPITDATKSQHLTAQSVLWP